MKLHVIDHDVVTDLLTLPVCIEVMRDTLIAQHHGCCRFRDQDPRNITDVAGNTGR